MKLHTKAAFSLVEVTMALGIAAFAMVAILGLLPVGLAGAHRASEQTQASQLANDLGEDLLATAATGKSPRFQITTPPGTTATTESFFLKPVETPPLESGDSDDSGGDSNIGYVRLQTKGGSRYAVQVTWRKSSINENLRIGSVTVWWPGEATLANCMGKVITSVAVNDLP